MFRFAVVLLALVSLACGSRGQDTPHERRHAQLISSPTAAPTPALGTVYHFPTDIRLEGEIDPPELITKVAPEIEDGWEKRTAQGIGVLRVIVDEGGNVRDVQMIHDPGFTPAWPDFEESCRTALSQWKYRPAMHDGTPVAIEHTVTVQYSDKPLGR
jgi:hypothetical protein